VSGEEDVAEDEQPVEAAAQLTIQQVSRLLDVPAPTIRSWERRYGLPQAHRTGAGHRRYTQVQVQALRQVRDAIARGQTAREAAILAKTAVMRSEAAQPLIEALLRAGQQLNSRHITETLDTAHARLGLDATIDDVLLPAMRQLGRDWQSGRCDVTHEHLATETVRAWLIRTAPDGPLSQKHQPIILTCGPEDHHTLGLESIGALLRQRRRDCRLLGASVPATSLAAAVHQIRPAAVVLVSHLSVARRSAVEALQVAEQALHTAELDQSHLFYAGNAFVTGGARRGVPGTYLGEDLTRAADLITTSIDRDAGPDEPSPADRSSPATPSPVTTPPRAEN
jgi:DNA-binding transcriptional MerR regulator